MKLTQKIALGVAAVVATSVGGTLAYRASVHEQNCLSYERQFVGVMDESIDILQKANDAQKLVAQNPFAAFGLIGEMGSLMTQTSGLFAKGNDLVYAYKGTCGAARYGKFMDRKDVVDKKNKIDALANNL